MIDILNANLLRIVIRFPFPEPWHERAVVILPFDKQMDDLAISVDSAHHDFAFVILQRLRLQITFATALRRFFPCWSCVLNCQRKHFHAVAMFVMVVCDRMIRPQRRGQDKGQLVLTDRIARPILHSRFRSWIGKALKTKRGLIKMRRLLGVTDVKLDVIGAL